MLFSELGLRAELLRAVENQGYVKPTTIQQRAIPQILEGRDVLASAQTGTGKTAAFVLPLIERYLAERRKPKSRRPTVLVLTPTRELAAQVAANATDLGRHLSVRVATIYGGVNINPQIAALERGLDLVVATPGRLLDHMQQRTIDLSDLKAVVLDEADRMLDMGFIRDMRRILGALPPRRQTLMFSATFSPEIRALADDFLHQPEEIAAAPRNATAERIEQTVYAVQQSQKRALLSYQIGAGNWRQVLVFTRTKHGADRLARQLVTDGLAATAIHGRKTQQVRTRALADFKSGKVRVLVATDIAARGLDIERLPHVVNFELPHVPEDYVHRIGRTARAGEDGKAISLVAPDEQRQLRAIERLLQITLQQETVPGYDSGAGAAGRGQRVEQPSGQPHGQRNRNSKRPGQSSKRRPNSSAKGRPGQQSDARSGEASSERPARGSNGHQGQPSSSRQGQPSAGRQGEPSNDRAPARGGKRSPASSKPRRNAARPGAGNGAGKAKRRRHG